MRHPAFQPAIACEAIRLAGRTTALVGIAALAALTTANAVAQGNNMPGFRLMSDGSRGNCLACHTLAGTPGVQSNFGPALDGVGSRLTADALRQWVTDARTIKPDTLMPPFGTLMGTQLPNRNQPVLNPDEITDVVAALQSLR